MTVIDAASQLTTSGRTIAGPVCADYGISEDFMPWKAVSTIGICATVTETTVGLTWGLNDEDVSTNATPNGNTSKCGKAFQLKLRCNEEIVLRHERAAAVAQHPQHVECFRVQVERPGLVLEAGVAGVEPKTIETEEDRSRQLHATLTFF